MGLLLLIGTRNDQLPVGLIAQLLEHCIRIAEVRVRVPLRPFYYLSTVAQLPRSLTLKLFPSAVRMIFHQNFTVERLVAWPLNENEAGVDLVLIQTLLLFLCKFL